MTDRYTVTHSPFGFENDVGSHRLNYAVTDNRPDRVTVYKAIEKERVQMTKEDASDYLKRPVPLPPFRHLAYSSCKQDAEVLASVMEQAHRLTVKYAVGASKNPRWNTCGGATEPSL